MQIRNRIADIKMMQAHILQDFFRMELAFNFSGDKWKTYFQKEVEAGVTSPYSRSYVGAWDKIQIKGLDNYSVDDMDTTIIIAILKGWGHFKCCKFDKINQSLDNFQDDRNIDAHATGNETDSELLQWAYGTFHNISKFVSDVDKSSHASDENRHSFARKYQSDIKELRKHFEDDYKEVLRDEEIEQAIKRDIDRILTNNNPFEIYVDIEGRYLKTMDSTGRIDFNLNDRFLHAAADKGIVWACPLLGDKYFEGLMTAVNYKKAEEYYTKGLSTLIPAQKLKLASIYINNLGDPSHTKEEGMILLKSCESSRWNIVSRTTKEGYEFYSIQRVRSN